MTLSHLTIWCSGQMALFLLFLAKTALACLVTAGTEATLSFLAGPVCSSFSVEACAILQFLCWSRQHHKFCHFSFPPLRLSLCPLLRLSFYLNFSGRSGRNCLLSPSVPSSYNGSSDTRFSRGATRLMSWPDGQHYSCPLRSLIFCLL